MGSAKVLIHAFLDYKNLKQCMGIEYCKTRFRMAVSNVLELANNPIKDRKFKVEKYKKDEVLIVSEVKTKNGQNGELN